MPGNVSLPMAVLADEPLLIKAIRMLGNAGQADRFIGCWLLCHPLTAHFAMFSRHDSFSCTIEMKCVRGTTTPARVSSQTLVTDASTALSSIRRRLRKASFENPPGRVWRVEERSRIPVQVHAGVFPYPLWAVRRRWYYWQKQLEHWMTKKPPGSLLNSADYLRHKSRRSM